MTTPLPETDMIDDEMVAQFEAELDLIDVPEDLEGEWNFEDDEGVIEYQCP